MRRIGVIFCLVLFLASCAPPPPIDKNTLEDYRLIARLRDRQFHSAAYLLDLRVDDAGRKFSVKTEIYVSGDSVGIYGRGFLGKGAFKANVIDDVVTIYFASENEYFTGPLAELDAGGDCAAPGEVMLCALSLLTAKDAVAATRDVLYPTRNEIRYRSGRFDRTVRLDPRGYPESEKLIDPACGDSIVVTYADPSRQFPFFKTQDVLYYNDRYDFRARGFVREQKYNIDLSLKKFQVDIPQSASRLDNL